MWIIFIALIIGVSLIVITTQINTERANGIFYSIKDSIYLSGYDEISGDKKVFLNAKKDIIEIVFPMQDITKIITMNDIINISCKTESEIVRDISLGRLLVFGAFSLGMKKNKNIVRKFIVIRYMDIDVEKDIIFETNSPDLFVQIVLKFKNELAVSAI